MEGTFDATIETFTARGKDNMVINNETPFLNGLNLCKTLSQCVQPDSSNQMVGSEDCLRLTVSSPKEPSTKGEHNHRLLFYNLEEIGFD